MSDVNEVLFDMSFQMGPDWMEVREADRDKILDMLGGSRGLYDWVLDEATAFENMWVNLDEDDPRLERYYEEVDAWFIKAFDKLVVRARNHKAGG